MVAGSDSTATPSGEAVGLSSAVGVVEEAAVSLYGYLMKAMERKEV